MIVEGINVVRELLNSNVKIEKIIAEAKNAQVSALLDLANRRGVKVELTTKQELEKIYKNKTQGIIAFIPQYRYADVKDILLAAEISGQKPFILVLDGIADPHNLGAIIRTAECAGVHGVIIPENRACDITDTVYKTSAGAVSHIKIAKVTNLTRTIDELKKQNIWCYALEAGEKSIYQADFTYPTAIVVGSEGKGVSHLVKQHCDETLSIPMFGNVNSLNASNASAIGTYEVVRQRSKIGR